MCLRDGQEFPFQLIFYNIPRFRLLVMFKTLKVILHNRITYTFYLSV
jgi:hypothetical protein